MQAWAAAARAGVAAVQKYGGAGPGHRTMLDALLPAVDNLEKATGVFEMILTPPRVKTSTRCKSTAAQGRATIPCWTRCSRGGTHRVHQGCVCAVHWPWLSYIPAGICSVPDPPLQQQVLMLSCGRLSQRRCWRRSGCRSGSQAGGGKHGAHGGGPRLYVPASALASTPDPGATAVGVWLGALARVISE